MPVKSTKIDFAKLRNLINLLKGARVVEEGNRERFQLLIEVIICIVCILDISAITDVHALEIRYLVFVFSCFWSYYMYIWLCFIWRFCSFPDIFLFSTHISAIHEKCIDNINFRPSTFGRKGSYKTTHIGSR